MDEIFTGYRFTGVVETDKSATHDGPTTLRNKDEIYQYLSDNIPTYPEIRIVDSMDNTVLHIVEQYLLFPLPTGVVIPPVWDPKTKSFMWDVEEASDIY